jgi:hypothetical protein
MFLFSFLPLRSTGSVRLTRYARLVRPCRLNRYVALAHRAARKIR